ncbi:MAG: aldehyde dehydrogenase family protein [Thermoleophilia bacterium]|nr:aldehyde dehydrogenase family protein [Thermoleophilia bacterium]
MFGPLVTVTPFESLDGAVALANGTRFGLEVCGSRGRGTSRP